MEHLTKFVYYSNEISKFRKGENVNPRRVQIDPVAFCNHDCQFCTYRYTRDEDMNALFNLKDMIPYPKFVELLDDFFVLGVRAIELTGGGEPSLHPQFVSILKELNARSFQIGLITNGAWKSRDFMAIVDELKYARWVRFSLDAATYNTHKITHSSRDGDFEMALKAIKYMSKTSSTTGVSFIVQKQNLHEIEDAVQLSESLGADYIRLGGVVFEGEKIDDIELDLDQHNMVLELIPQMKRKYNIKIVDNFSTRSCVDFATYLPGEKCYYAHLGTTIGADLKLYPCCIWKYRPAGVISDLNKVSFVESWQSGAVSKFFENFDISEQCNRCYLKDKNDFIHSLVSKDLTHVDFV